MHKHYSVIVMFSFFSQSFCMQTEEPSKQHEQPLNFSKTIFVGAGTGLSEVVTGRPLDYLKTKMVTKQAISPNIGDWYRGVGVHMASIVPTTIVQTQLEQTLQHVVPSTYAASTAGALSGLFATPCERIILEQQQYGKGLQETIRIIMQKGSKELFKGLPMVSVRELLFTAGYMQIMPQLSKTLDAYIDSSVVKQLGAATVGGTALALASHPAESIRIWQQTGKGQTIADVIKAMSRDKAGLIENLFAGASYRTGRYALALAIMAEAREKITSIVKE